MDSMLRMPMPILDDSGFCRELGEVSKNIAFRVIEPIERERDQPDRRTLDDLLFDYFGLSTDECDAVYEAIINLVKSRLS